MATSNRRLAASAAVGFVVGASIAAMTPWQVAVLAGWCAAALTFVVRVLAPVRRFDAQATAAHATEEEPSVLVADATLVIAAIASLIGVGFVLAKAGDGAGATRGLSTGIGVVSVTLAWTVVQLVFTLRYARLYYDEQDGGIDFGAEAPDYSDFAYLAFTVGMTYQVSDTTITSRGIRRVVLHHALLSFVFATAFIAVLVNLVGGLL